MNFPPCPNGRFDCRFVDAGSSSTTMNSPLEFDRAGAAVGGGRNTVASVLKCAACSASWACSQTELAWAQGVEGKWEPLA